MDNISAEQLQNYETTLQLIDEEYKKHEKLKKSVEQETDRLVAVRVGLQQDFARRNVFRTLVKVFDSLLELRDLYGSEISNDDFDKLMQSTTESLDTKIYLVEICVSKLFYAKLVGRQQWLLSVTVSNASRRVSQTVDLGNRKHNNSNNKNRIYVVVPFDSNATEPCTVACRLFVPLDETWSIIELAVVQVDVSYHLGVSNTQTKPNLVDILSRYTPNDKVSTNEPIKYKFKCQCTRRHFFETLVKNCYHRLNSQLLSLFAEKDERGQLAVNLYATDNNKDASTTNLYVELDRSKKELVLQAGTAKQLDSIKKYLISELSCQRLSVEKTWLVSLHNLRGCVQNEMCSDDEMNQETLRVIYDGLRKLIFEMPA